MSYLTSISGIHCLYNMNNLDAPYSFHTYDYGESINTNLTCFLDTATPSNEMNGSDIGTDPTQFSQCSRVETHSTLDSQGQIGRTRRYRFCWWIFLTE